MSLNHVAIMGRFTRDPELKRTQSGKSIVAFSLAVDNDSKEKQTCFIDCVAWNRTAEFISTYFRKGRMAVVSGRLQVRDWEKDGERRKTMDVVVDNIYFGDSKSDGAKPSDFRDTPSEELPF